MTAYTDTRPHTLTGDITLTDVDVSVNFNIPFGYPEPGALLGGRVSPWNLTRGGGKSATQALDIAPGVWMYVDPYGWKVRWGGGDGVTVSPEAMGGKHVRHTAPYQPMFLPNPFSSAIPSLQVYNDLTFQTTLASGPLPTSWNYGTWATMRLVIRGNRAIGLYYQPPSTEAEMRNRSASDPRIARYLKEWEARNGAGKQLRGAANYPTQPMAHKPSNVTVQAAVLFNVDISNLPTAGLVGLGTADYGQAVQWQTFQLSVDSAICNLPPVSGQAVEVELCAPSPGQAFDFVRVDNDDSHIVFNRLPNFDVSEPCTVAFGLQSQATR